LVVSRERIEPFDRFTPNELPRKSSCRCSIHGTLYHEHSPFEPNSRLGSMTYVHFF
jgi:hypothetical protein